jgi:YjbE family integral membrane protein
VLDWLNLSELFTHEGLVALGQVLLIDLVLAGDNAIVVGLAVFGLPVEIRKKAIFIGIAAAAVMRIGFAAITTHLLGIIGLTLAGGVLLLWVCWKMWREIKAQQAEADAAALVDGDDSTNPTEAAPTKTLGQAIIQILIADLSMSLDNVLAVAGAARHNTSALVIGLIMSVVLMAVAAQMIAKLLHRYRWIAYIGLFMILYISLKMVWDGSREVLPFVAG